ncbi:MAG: 50S ribosomal protein L10 [bacterium]
MPKLKRKDKERLVEELIIKIKSSEGIILSDFHGLDAEKMTRLRRTLHKSGVYLKVVKNRLAKLALDEVDQYKKAKEILKDRPTMIALINDPFLSARDLVKFFEDEEVNFQFRAGYISGREIDYEFLKEIGAISSKNEVYGKLVNILISPIERFALSVNNIIQKLVFILNEVARKREDEVGS